MSTLELRPVTATEPFDPMLPIWYRILRVSRESHDTISLELGLRDGQTDFQFAPGQFNMIYVYGVGEVPVSISGDPARTDQIVHTVRAVGSVTRAMWNMTREDTIGVRGPFGSAWPVEQAAGRDVVIVSGGIGFAPLRPALYHVLRHRKEYSNVVLLYGARTPDDLLFGPELLDPIRRPELEIGVTVDRAPGHWSGNIGVVTSLIPGASFDPENAIAMVCGPEVMMRYTVQALCSRGMSKADIYVSMERNMKCAVGFCGHCQYGPKFICKDGPVFRLLEIENLFGIREL